MTDQHPDITQPHGAPDQKARVLEWLRTEPGGLTQLQALQHLAVARLAAVIYRLREDDGHTITTELVEMPTRYGPAQVARYHLAPAQPASPPARVPTREGFAFGVTPDGGTLVRSDGKFLAMPVESLGRALPLREPGNPRPVGYVVTAPVPTKTPEELARIRREAFAE